MVIVKKSNLYTSLHKKISLVASWHDKTLKFRFHSIGQVRHHQSQTTIDLWLCVLFSNTLWTGWSRVEVFASFHFRFRSFTSTKSTIRKWRPRTGRIWSRNFTLWRKIVWRSQSLRSFGEWHFVTFCDILWHFVTVLSSFVEHFKGPLISFLRLLTKEWRYL